MNFGKKVLLAEDDELTRFMMGEILDTFGFRFDLARDGQECKDMIEANPDSYGIILMDVHMPGISGIDAALAIRKAGQDPPKNIPIYAVTADADYHDNQAVREKGMDGFIRKPIDATEVTTLVSQFCPAA
ncbi:MAG: response regulator [Marinovum sp.]|nr:response regulator [Marinovum sp.]